MTTEICTSTRQDATRTVEGLKLDAEFRAQRPDLFYQPDDQWASWTLGDGYVLQVRCTGAEAFDFRLWAWFCSPRSLSEFEAVLFAEAPLLPKWGWS